MHPKCILVVCLFTLLGSCHSRPRTKPFDSETEAESEVKEWETQKHDFPLFEKLEKSGVGIKRSAASENDNEETKIEIVESAKSPSAPKVEDLRLADDLLLDDQSAARVKKQSPNNVCIKIGGCGKTVCGPIVSARGPVVGDMRTMLQSGKPMSSLNDMHASTMSELNQVSGKMEPFSPVQGRTVDLMGVAPVSLGYGSPAIFAAPGGPESSSLSYGHSFIKPPSVPTVSALPVALVPQHSSHPLVHPWLLTHLMPHLLPHVLPHLVSSVTPSLPSFIVPHRFEPQRFPEMPQTELKQPMPAIPQTSYVPSDSAMICQPFRNQRFENPYEFMYKPDMAIDKSINVSDAVKKVQGAPEDEGKIRDHLRKVNEIKEEISQLNRAAQRIVDQQERLTEMQQKQMWGTSSMSSMQGSHSMDHMTTPYMGTGYYSHPTMPWGYSRSNILSYPNSHDDIEFFLNLLRAGKKFGLISDSLQPVMSTVGEVIKGGQESSKMQKDSIDNVSPTVRTDDSKSKPIKPSSP